MDVVVAVWTGHEARALRASLRMTIEAFAEHLGVTARTVAKWEARGPTIVPVPEIQGVLDTALERATPAQQARFDILRRRGWAPGTVPGGARVDPRAGAPSPWDPVPSSGDTVDMQLLSALHTAANADTLDPDMKRRAFLHGVPAALLLSRAGLPQLRWIKGDAAMANEATLDTLVAAIAAEKRLCDQLGSRAVQGLAAEHVRLATDLLRASPAALRPRVAAVASEAAAEAGFVCADQRQLPAAQSYYQTAAELAQEAGDPRLEAFVLGSWSRRLAEESYLYRLDAAEGGDGAQALSFVERAQAIAARRPSPATLAYLATIEAEVQAAEDADASLRALERLDEALARAEPSENPPWLLWMDADHLRGVEGYCYMRMGRLDDADTVLGQALSDRDPSFVRTRARDLVTLAFVRLQQQEIEECCHLAEEGLEGAVATGSSRSVQRFGGSGTSGSP